MTVRILIGPALDRLAELPDESVHTCITSPPYWGLRAYRGDAGMIGLEPTFDEHLENLVAVFREVRRVLRSDGTLWLNYGDAYAHSGGGGNGATGGLDKSTLAAPMAPVGTTPQRANLPAGFKPKDLMMMPARVAMALQADGWWLRSEIVWHKPNPMPESCTDRPTSAHEKVFLLSKSARYFYDAEAVRVAAIRAGETAGGRRSFEGQPNPVSGEVPSAANLRNVWTIATHAYSGAHFATFPPALVEPCIKAGTSAKGACGECGAPWVRETSKTVEHTSGSGRSGRQPKGKHEGSEQAESGTYDIRMGPVVHTATTGWSPSCECDAGEPVPAVVLDIFAGSGTVGLVADRLQRDAILIEINAEYAEMARARIADEAGELFGRPVEPAVGDLFDAHPTPEEAAE